MKQLYFIMENEFVRGTGTADKEKALGWLEYARRTRHRAADKLQLVAIPFTVIEDDAETSEGESPPYDG